VHSLGVDSRQMQYTWPSRTTWFDQVPGGEHDAADRSSGRLLGVRVFDGRLDDRATAPVEIGPPRPDHTVVLGWVRGHSCDRVLVQVGARVHLGHYPGRHQVRVPYVPFPQDPGEHLCGWRLHFRAHPPQPQWVSVTHLFVRYVDVLKTAHGNPSPVPATKQTDIIFIWRSCLSTYQLISIKQLYGTRCIIYLSSLLFYYKLQC